MEAFIIRKKRKASPSAENDSESLHVKKPKANSACSEAVALPQLLDFSTLNDISAISDRFDEIGNALLHDHTLVVQCGEMETEFKILELEFYLQKHKCHEDPFTHGSEEQKICGRWCAFWFACSIYRPLIFLVRYFHRAPQWSADSHRSMTSLTEYRSGSRKGLDLTIGRPLTTNSPHFVSASTTIGGRASATVPVAPLLLGGALLRTIQRVSDSKVISGPSLLVDQILSLSKASSISDLVENKWARDTSAFPSSPVPESQPASASLYLKPVTSSKSAKPQVYRSPRIGLELSHSGTTATPTHPRVVFLSKRYRYFTRPNLLTSNGRTQTFLGVLQMCVDSGQYGKTPFKRPGLRKALTSITGSKDSTVTRYLADYQAGIDGGKLESFVGPPGKGASSSPTTYLKMMGTLERLRIGANSTAEQSSRS